jgi:hypothetical protein
MEVTQATPAAAYSLQAFFAQSGRGKLIVGVGKASSDCGIARGPFGSCQCCVLNVSYDIKC